METDETKQQQQQQLLKKGHWTPEEDLVLKRYIEAHGEGKWTTVSKRSGLMRGGKSCRMRWMNYLRPNLKHGNMSQEEEDLILRMHKLVGNRWALIAGRIHGRTDNEIKNYWNTYLSKKHPEGENRNNNIIIERKRRKLSSNTQDPAPHELLINVSSSTTADQYQSSGAELMEGIDASAVNDLKSNWVLGALETTTTKGCCRCGKDIEGPPEAAYCKETEPFSPALNCMLEYSFGNVMMDSWTTDSPIYLTEENYPVDDLL